MAWVVRRLNVYDTSVDNVEILERKPEKKLIASGSGLRDRRRLNRTYGRGKWRKYKGSAKVRFPDGTVEDVELHWYEAHGIGRREEKVKPR